MPLSLETLARVSSIPLIWHSLSDPWKGVALRLTRDFGATQKPYLFLGDGLYAALLSPQHERTGALYRRAILLAIRLHDLELPSLQKLGYLPDGKGLLSTAPDDDDCFASDEARQRFLWLHADRLNRRMADRVIERWLPSSTGDAYRGLMNVEAAMRGYVRMRYVGIRQMQRCAASFFEYLYGHSARTVVYAPLSYPVVDQRVDGMQGDPRTVRHGRKTLKSTTLSQLKDRVQLPTEQQVKDDGLEDRFSAERLYAIAHLRAYYAYYEEVKSSSEVVLTHHLPVGLPSEKIYWRESLCLMQQQQQQPQPATARTAFYCLQPMDFYYALHNLFQTSVLFKSQQGDGTRTWVLWAREARRLWQTRATASGALHVSIGSRTAQVEHEPVYACWQRVVARSVAAGAVSKEQLLPAFLLYYNECGRPTDSAPLVLSQYRIRDLSKGLARFLPVAKQQLYVAQGEFAKWLGARSVADVSSSVLKQHHHRKRPAAESSVLSSSSSSSSSSLSHHSSSFNRRLYMRDYMREKRKRSHVFKTIGEASE